MLEIVSKSIILISLKFSAIEYPCNFYLNELDFSNACSDTRFMKRVNSRDKIHAHENSPSFSSKISELEEMKLSKLRQTWIDTIGTPVPQVSATILRLALAFELQATEFGGLSQATIRRLDMLAREGKVSFPVQPGMRLVREWQGKLHVVAVDDAGNLIWQDRQWRSLSEVARAITGTRWSGPAFFGLIEKVRAA